MSKKRAEVTTLGVLQLRKSSLGTVAEVVSALQVRASSRGGGRGCVVSSLPQRRLTLGPVGVRAMGGVGDACRRNPSSWRVR